MQMTLIEIVTLGPAWTSSTQYLNATGLVFFLPAHTSKRLLPPRGELNLFTPSIGVCSPAPGDRFACFFFFCAPDQREQVGSSSV